MEIDFATGSKVFAKQFTEMLNGCIAPKFYFKEKRANYYNIRCATSGAELFYKKVYYLDSVHLKRKKDKFEEIMKERKGLYR